MNNAVNTNFVVYQVTSPKTDYIYYGYSEEEDIESAFLKGATRQDNPDRGDVRMLLASGGEDYLKFKLLDVFDNEVEAFMERNDYRARDNMSITGPSNFPTAVFQRALAINPDIDTHWKLASDIKEASGREAMGEAYCKMSVYSYADVKQLVSHFPKSKEQVVSDLDGLKYPEFAQKYFPQRNVFALK